MKLSLFQEPEMLQPDVFCKHTMIASHNHQLLDGFKGAASQWGGGGERKMRRGAGREGKGSGG